VQEQVRETWGWTTFERGVQRHHKLARSPDLTITLPEPVMIRSLNRRRKNAA
jgi:hypothetical protein